MSISQKDHLQGSGVAALLRLESEHKLMLDRLQTDVRIRVYFDVFNKCYIYAPSHHFQAPNAIGPHYSSVLTATTHDEALELGINYVLSHLPIGKPDPRPEPNWVIPNEQF